MADGVDRAEQKRQRERQRRSDLTHAFEELKELLNQVEERQYAEVDDITARVDTIRRANDALRRLMQENRELKWNLAQAQMHHPSTTNSGSFLADAAARDNIARQSVSDSQIMRSPNLDGLVYPAATGPQIAEMPLARETVAHQSAPDLQRLYPTVSGKQDKGNTRGQYQFTHINPLQEIPLPQPALSTPDQAKSPSQSPSQQVFPADTALSIQSLISVAHGLPPSDHTAWMPMQPNYSVAIDPLLASRPDYEPFAIPGLDDWKPGESGTTHRDDQKLPASPTRPSRTPMQQPPASPDRQHPP